MAKEIERRFLVDQVPASVEKEITPLYIRQGYITTDPSGQQVRVRSKGDKYYLTVKGKGKLEREETEIELLPEQFDTLWSLTEGRRVQKRRYEIPYQTHIIELDIFEGKLDGLQVAEVEFSSVAESTKLVLPDWFEVEVTEDTRYANSQLARSQSIPERI